MVLLWTPSLRPDSPRYVPRSYITRFVLDWVPHVEIQPPPNGVWQETLFGGYRLHITFKSFAWSWTTKTFSLLDMFTDVYVEPPGGGTPLSAGLVQMAYFLDGLNDQPTIDFVNYPSSGYYTYYKTPPPPPGYYGPPRADKPPP